MFSQIGPLEIILVLVIALIVLGPRKLPEAGRSMGKGIREFRDSISGHGRDDDEPVAAPSAPVEQSRETLLSARERELAEREARLAERERNLA